MESPFDRARLEWFERSHACVTAPDQRPEYLLYLLDQYRRTGREEADLSRLIVTAPFAQLWESPTFVEEVRSQLVVLQGPARDSVVLCRVAAEKEYGLMSGVEEFGMEARGGLSESETEPQERAVAVPIRAQGRVFLAFSFPGTSHIAGRHFGSMGAVSIEGVGSELGSGLYFSMGASGTLRPSPAKRVFYIEQPWRWIRSPLPHKPMPSPEQ